MRFDILLATIILAASTGGLTMAEQRTHPCLYVTSEDVRRAKQNMERFEWARVTAQEVIGQADKWLDISEDRLRDLIPPRNAVFAYGFHGCPECGASWPWWGARGVADIARPRTAQCPSCKKVFPDENHPDTGDGWLDPKTGKRYYFVGVYNSHAIQTLTMTSLDSLTGEQFGVGALDALSNAYVLTGDEKYAKRAAFILDLLADIYPTCTVGSIDYPGAPGGRFERTQYQVARVIVLLARYYDLIYNSPALDQPSITGMRTIHAAVEERMFKDAANYCLSEGDSGRYGLTNGEADFVRGVLGVGLLLDIPEYIKWALEGPYCIYNFLENNLLRDGQYYETSVGYSDHALNVYADMAEMLQNYQTAEHPDGIDLYSHPKFARALIGASLDVYCAGHLPRFGDWGPDYRKLTQWNEYNPTIHMRAEQLYAAARSEADRTEKAELLRRVCGGDVGARRFAAPRSARMWLLYNAEPVSSNGPVESIFPAESALLDGKGLALLRSGSGLSGRAALVRYGPSVCHGHRDDLNINFFALGWELTYDIGYDLGSSHVQTGWARQTASHNLVVVNETSQGGTGATGGSAHFFATGSDISVAEVSAEPAYESEKVDVYRRTCALIDSGSDSSYLVDIFRVSGGHTHDLLWHGLGEMSVTGAKLGDVQSVGSLAGPEYDWGRQIGPDGDILGYPGKPYWVAPPQNGYGFLYDIRRGQVSGDMISATWKPDPGLPDTMEISVLPPADAEVITAQGPGILPKLPKANYAIVRRKGDDLHTSFVSVVQPYSGHNPVRRIERLTPRDDTGMPVGIRVILDGERTDYVLSSLDPRQEHAFSDGKDRYTLRGRLAIVRLAGGTVREALLVGATHLSVGGLTVSAEHGGFWGTIESVDYTNRQLVVNRELPTDGSLVGTRIYISRPEYSHKSCYVITDVTRKDGHTLISLDAKTLILAKGYTDPTADPGTQEIRNIVPLEMASSNWGKSTGYFKGKLLESEDGTRATIINVVGRDGGKKTIFVSYATRFGKGQRLTIYDVQAGDGFEIPTVMTIERTPGGLRVSSPTKGSVELNGKRMEFKRGLSLLSM